MGSNSTYYTPRHAYPYAPIHDSDREYDGRAPKHVKRGIADGFKPMAANR